MNNSSIDPTQDELALAMAFLDCRPHTALPLARLMADARLKERERWFSWLRGRYSEEWIATCGDLP